MLDYGRLVDNDNTFAKIVVKAQPDVTRQQAHTATQLAVNTSLRNGFARYSSDRALQHSTVGNHAGAIEEHVASALIHEQHHKEHQEYFDRGEIHPDVENQGTPVGPYSHENAAKLHWDAARKHESVSGNYAAIPSEIAYNKNGWSGNPTEDQRIAPLLASVHAQHGRHDLAIENHKVAADYQENTITKGLTSHNIDNHKISLDAHRKGIAANTAMIHFPGYLHHEGHTALNDTNFLGALSDKVEDSGDESSARHIREHTARQRESKAIDDHYGILLEDFVVKGETEKAIHTAIHTEPDEKLHGLALADYLEEQGKPHHANFIRSHVAQFHSSGRSDGIRHYPRTEDSPHTYFDVVDGIKGPDDYHITLHQKSLANPDKVILWGAMGKTGEESAKIIHNLRKEGATPRNPRRAKVRTLEYRHPQSDE